MPLAAIGWIIGSLGVAGLGLGFFADKAGEATKDSGNAALKLAAAGVVTYIILKKTKVL